MCAAKKINGGVSIQGAKPLQVALPGVVSKKLIGERKIAKAIRSCNFLLACIDGSAICLTRAYRSGVTYFD